MSRFNCIENKSIYMRTLIVLSVMLLAVGTVSAQDGNVTAEDFTTPEPEFAYRMNPVDGLFTPQNFTTYEADESSGFTDNGNYITIDASTNGYISAFKFQGSQGATENYNEEWMRGKVEIEHDFDNVDEIQYNLVQVSDPDNSLSNIRQSHNLETVSGSTNGQETITLQWDEEDLIEDSNFDVTNTKTPEHVGIQIWPTTGGQSVDIHSMDFVDSETTYTETMYNGTLSTSWQSPEQSTFGSYGDLSLLDSEIVGSEGDYRWEVTTDDIYIAEYDLNSISPSELQYYMVNASVPEGAELYYGLGRDNHESSVAPYEFSEGIAIVNDDSSDSKVQPIFNDVRIDTTDQGLNSDMRPYHFEIGGLLSGDRTFSATPYDNDGQTYWEQYSRNSRQWYWRAGDVTFDLPYSLPQDQQYDTVILAFNSIDEGSHTFQIRDVSYGPTPSELDPGIPIDTDGGEPVEPIEDRNEIVDGGIVDKGITAIANYTGLGLTATRFLLGILISLGVGLGVGWSEEYGSTTLGAMAFGFTFISLMLVGLVPMVYGLIFTLVAGGAGWLSWKNQTDKVVVNG